MAKPWGTALRIFRNRTRFFRFRTLFRVYRTLSFTPVVASLAILAILWLPPQMQEVYASLLTEPGGILQALLGLFLLCFVSILLFCWHLFFSWPRIDRLYREYPYLSFDRALHSICVSKAAVLSMIPFLGLILGLSQVSAWARKNKEIVGQDASSGLIGRLHDLTGPQGDGLTSDWRALSTQLGALEQNAWVAIAFTIVAAIAVFVVTKRIARVGRPAKRWMLWIATGVAATALIFPLLDPALTVNVAWRAGPIAAIATVFISAIAILCWLSILSLKSPLPFIPLLVVAGVAAVGVGIQGNVSHKDSAAPQAGSRAVASDECRRVTSDIRQTNAGGTSQSSEGGDRPSMAASCQIVSTFRDWLEKRQDKESFAGKPYPVFIVAAQGGGIYASAAAAHFLSSMQDDCPNFAGHVFAVSAVSGGSVGTAIFDALYDPAGSSASPCDFGSNRRLSNASRQVLRRDHLSPVVSMIVPDILRKLPVLNMLKPEENRASMLETSLAQAIAHQAKHELTAQSAVENWKAADQKPMSVLNTTWVENGYRVAFAPVPLNEISDGTLFSFKELNARLGEPQVRDKSYSQASLIREAVVSARFPLMSPAWNISLAGNARWNFVDGGYSDNSGATTAVEIYKALNHYSQEKDTPKFDLRLIILNNTQPDFSPERIDGSKFSDIGAPISALLNVRSQMSVRAVTSAIDQIEPAKESNAQLFNGRDAATHVMFVQLEQRTFPLSLGWKISPEEYELVKLLLGDPRLVGDPRSAEWPNLCKPKTIQLPTDPLAQIDRPVANTDAADQNITLDTIMGNSCVKFNIARLLLGEGKGS